MGDCVAVCLDQGRLTDAIHPASIKPIMVTGRMRLLLLMLVLLLLLLLVTGSKNGTVLDQRRLGGIEGPGTNKRTF